jgi:lysozyme
MIETDTMTPSQAALDLLHEFEQGPQGGMASVPYKDFAGHPTIGWGHKILPGEWFSLPLTAAQADDLLRSDLERFAAGVNSWVTVPITQSMFDALVCFAADEGLGALQGSALLRLLNQYWYAAAAQQFERWDEDVDPATGKQVVSPHKKRRRLAERRLFEKDGYQP